MTIDTGDAHLTGGSPALSRHALSVLKTSSGRRFRESRSGQESETRSTSAIGIVGWVKEYGPTRGPSVSDVRRDAQVIESVSDESDGRAARVCDHAARRSYR
jgi:hypothetical protein